MEVIMQKPFSILDLYDSSNRNCCRWAGNL